MTTYTWIGATNTSWSLAANWSPQGIPTASDDVIFNITNNNPCTVTVSSPCRSLTIGSGYNSTITLNNSIVVGIVTGSGIPFIPPFTSYAAVVINGAPTFIYNPNAATPGCVQVTNNVSSTVVGVSSSRSTNVPLRIVNGATNAGLPFRSTVNFSGSILTSYLEVSHVGVASYWGGANGSQIILSGSVSSPAIFRNPSASISNLAPTSSDNPTYVPPFICSGSVSWRFNGSFPFPLSVASQSIFQYTASTSPNNLGGTSFNGGGKSFYTFSNPLNVDIHPSASLLCTTSSYLQIQGGLVSINMSGSTTNKWNGLNLLDANFRITSDVWLEQNQNLISNINATNHPFGIGTLQWSGVNYITGSAGRTIYIGGNLAGGANQSINQGSSISPIYLSYPAGPRLLMYGAGYIGAPYMTRAIVAGNTNLGNVDLEISSSKNIGWGTPNDPGLTINGANNRIIYTTADLWTVYTNSFSPGPGIVDLKGRGVWNLISSFNGTFNFSSSLVCSGSLIVYGNTSINSSSLTNPTISVLQNVVSTQSVQTGTTIPAANIGAIFSGSVPIQMVGNLPATYSLSVIPFSTALPCPNITINKPEGSVLIKNIISSSAGTPPILWERPLNYGNGTFRYIAGTINAGTSTLQLISSASMDTAGINIPWYNITISGSGTGTARGSLINIISPLVITNELNLGAAGNVAFTGSDTWQCSRLICTTPGRRITLQNAASNGQKAYTTTTFVNLSSSGAPISMSSDLIGTRASWSVDLNSPPVQLYNTDGIWIDSSGGRTIWTTGVTQSTINWNPGLAPFTPLGSIYTFFID